MIISKDSRHDRAGRGVRKPPRRAGWLAAVAAVFIAASCVPAPRPGPPPPSGACGGPHWVASWGAAQSDASIGFDAAFGPIPGTWSEQTIRNVISPHLGGTRVLLHLTNRYNPNPVTYGAVSIGRSEPNGGVAAPVAVRFDGRPSVTLGPGQDAVSDPIDMTVVPFQQLAVSLYLPRTDSQLTKHWNSNATTFITSAGAGDRTEDRSGDAFSGQVQSWLGVLGLDVEATGDTRSIVALGDSLTDGWVSADPIVGVDLSVAGQDQRYPDFLQRRIHRDGLPLSVINAGLSSNQVVSTVFPIAGPSAVDRFSVDVPYFATSRGVIIFEGINDLGLSHASAGAIIAGYRQLIEKARAADLKVWLATLTPASNAITHGTFLAPNSERDRQIVNRWIRFQSEADGYFDFDAAVRDPARPSVLASRYASADNLHMSAAGYRRIADSIDLEALATTTC